MSWDQRGGSGQFGPAGAGGGYGGIVVPPPPPHPPTVPPGPADPWRAVAVALLNLSGLGLGYALIRSWIAMVGCWFATGVLLLGALPADPDGVPGWLLVGYLVTLGLAALHGAFRGLRTRLSWPPRSLVAVVLGLVLLAAPAGSVVLYDGARDEATQQMLLARLDDADRLVRTAGNQPFDAAEPDYRKALAAYRDLNDDHPGSRAAKRVPDRLDTYYKTVGAAYDDKRYCDAIGPLKYLRTVPDTIGRKQFGSLATWPDDRLATSLFECGVKDIGTEGDGATEDGHLGELLTAFPESPQAAKVEPAVSSAIDKSAKAAKGDDPCPAVDRLRTLSSQAASLPGDKAGVAAALGKDADRADKGVRSGTYACGVDQYKDKDFDAAAKTLNEFIGKYRKDKKRARAEKIVIAAEIAQSEPAAGRRLPTTASGGGITLTVSNDSPDAVEILYTGPVTGRFTLKACGGCTTYSSDAAARRSACKDSGTNYPKRTISLPAGTTYILHKSKGTSAARSGTDTVKIQPGYVYTECAYVVSGFDLGL